MITLITIGKVKKQYVKAAVADYSQRLKKHCKFNYKVADKFKDQDLQGYLIALEVTGKQLSSEEFSKYINQTTMDHKDITFLIGGPNGIPKEALRKVHKKISLSNMTFPNELVRAIFLEQLYRAFSIQKNQPYHK
ncbi:23S rRNA (pseudouridine(1915)-N(3))-methyltransferase RlmH [archaeon]|nr:23S rRNA (pseudouridine(1915)-N(3))-methyltransferase RlmH [archaeon]|tara:strand:+ start:4357 stop:4761 length:405 start_codon:yes stop_codon:yes gene_type:complete